MLANKTTLSLVVSLGLAQTIAWASSYYLPAVLARHMASSLGCPSSTVYAAFSVALVIAALTVPFAGRCIDTWGGKPVLVSSNIWFALSLIILSQTQGKWSLFLGWALLGLAMGAGLYDMAFAAVVRSRGSAAPPVIAGITLVAGFASTVGWPVTHYLLSTFGWRQALVVWAAIHLFLAFPLNFFSLLPLQADRTMCSSQDADSPRKSEKKAIPAMMLLAIAFVCTSFCNGAMASHLPALIQLFGIGAAASILAGMAFGPAQVSARLLYLFALQKMHPLTTAILAVFTAPLGAVLLSLSVPGAVALVGVTHGFGNGLLTIIKGILPLILFGERGYGRRQGLLFMPAAIVQAISPFLFSLCVSSLSTDALYLYIGTMWTTVLLFLWLKRLVEPQRKMGQGWDKTIR